MDNIDIIFDELINNWDKYPPVLRMAMAIVLGLLAVCAVVSVVISIYLAISYHRYNNKQNSINQTGQQIAEGVLNIFGLSHIQVKCSGSMMFGNSYSHYFKKVRLRRRTWKRASVSSLAMAMQKSCLAVLDQEQDPDMVTRIRLTPFIYLGPIACIPLIIIGFVLDTVIFHAVGSIAAIATVLGIGLYTLSFIMSLMVLKTEVKAQNRAYEVARTFGYATEEEIDDMKQLFRLYNIEYVNDMITALLELVLRLLSILANSKNSSSKG